MLRRSGDRRGRGVHGLASGTAPSLLAGPKAPPLPRPESAADERIAPAVIGLRGLLSGRLGLSTVPPLRQLESTAPTVPVAVAGWVALRVYRAATTGVLVPSCHSAVGPILQVETRWSGRVQGRGITKGRWPAYATLEGKALPGGTPSGATAGPKRPTLDGSEG